LVESTDIIQIPGKESVTLHFRTKEKLNKMDWDFTVLNAVNSPNTHPTIHKKGITVL
jgi:hypothetical protein